MPAGDIQNQVTRIDTLDSKPADKKVKIDDNEIPRLTETYIAKTTKLQEAAAKLDPADPQRKQTEEGITNFLKQVDSKNIEKKEKELRKNIDTHIDQIEKRKEIQDLIHAIDTNPNRPGFWRDISVQAIYEKVLGKGIVNITKDQVKNLQNYIQQTGKIGLDYVNDMMYFDSTFNAANDQVLKKYANPEIVEAMLSGATMDAKQKIDEFKQCKDNVLEKRKECTTLGKILESLPGGSRLKTIIYRMSQDHSSLIEFYAVAVDKNHISLDTIQKTLSQICSSKEFQDMDPAEPKESGFSSPKELFDFLIMVVQRGGLKDGKSEVNTHEIERLRAELRAKQEFNTHHAMLQKMQHEAATEVQKQSKDIEDFKTKHTAPDGTLYSKMSEEDFYKLARLEHSQASSQLKYKQYELASKQTEAIYAMVLSHIKNTSDADIDTHGGKFVEGFFNVAFQEPDDFADRDKTVSDSYDDFFRQQKEIYNNADFAKQTDIFSGIAGLESETSILKTEFQEKQQQIKGEKKQFSEGSLSADLAYRRFLESGVNDKDTTNVTVNEKQRKYRELGKEVEKLEPLIQESLKSFDAMKKEIGSWPYMATTFESAPPEMQQRLSQKGKGLLELLNISTGYLSQMEGLTVEIYLLKPSEKIENTFSPNEKYREQKDIIANVTDYLGEKLNLPDIDVASPEIQNLIKISINEEKLNSAGKTIDNFSKVSEETGEAIGDIINNINQPYGGNVVIGTPMKRLRAGAGYMDNMINALENGQSELEKAKSSLERELNGEPSIFRNNQQFREVRNKVIRELIRGVDNLLTSQFSEGQKQELIKARNEFQKNADKMRADTLKHIVVFTLTVAATMVTGGLAHVGSGAFATFINCGARAANIIKFAGGEIGGTLGGTFGSRGAMYVVGHGHDVNWSMKGMVKDFGMKLGISVLGTGGSTILRKWIGSKSFGSTGFTYGEMSQFGLSKLNFMQSLGRPKGASSEIVTTTEKAALKKAEEGVVGEAKGVSAKELVEHSLHGSNAFF